MSARVLIESLAHCISQRNGSRYEFLVRRMHPNRTLFCIVSSLDLLKPLGYGFASVHSLLSGQTFTRACACVCGTTGDYVRMEPHTVGFLLLVALSLGLSRGDGCQCSDLNCRVGFQVMHSLGASLLLWPRALAARFQDGMKLF